MALPAVQTLGAHQLPPRHTIPAVHTTPAVQTLPGMAVRTDVRICFVAISSPACHMSRLLSEVPAACTTRMPVLKRLLTRTVHCHTQQHLSSAAGVSGVAAMPNYVASHPQGAMPMTCIIAHA